MLNSSLHVKKQKNMIYGSKKRKEDLNRKPRMIRNWLPALCMCVIFVCALLGTAVPAGFNSQAADSQSVNSPGNYANETASHPMSDLPGQDVSSLLSSNISRKTSTPTVDPVHESDSFSAVLYDNTNGLPTSEANDIVQTSEGFIWIGSYGGLIRYDGNTFERMDASMGIGSVVSLCVDTHDRLWIGTNDNGVAVMDQGELTWWDEAEGLNSSKVTDIVEGIDGSVYVSTTAGINRIMPDMSIRSVDAPEVKNLYVDQMRIGNDGVIHVISNEGDYFTMNDGKILKYTAHEDTNIERISSVLPDPDFTGKLFVGTEESEVYICDESMNKDNMVRVDISPLFNVIDIRKFGNQIWISSRSGLGVLVGTEFHYLENLPMNNSVDQIMQDYEGNLWFTSSRQGVMKLVYNKFSDVFTRYGIPSAVVNSTCMYEDKLFIGTDTGLIVLDEENGDTVEKLPLTEAKSASGKDLGGNDLIELLADCRIRSILPDSKGRIWLSTWRSNGLLCYDKGKLTSYSVEEGLLSNQIRAVSESSNGEMYVVCTGGVSVIKDGRVTASYSGDAGIENQESLSVAAAPNGDIVLGSNGGGIYVINEKGTRCISKKDGLSSGIVMKIKYDEAWHVFWLITGNSISYMTEDYRVVTVDKFPFSNNFDLYKNSKDDMWVLSSNGIYVLPTSQLVANEDISPVHYGMENGIPCISTSNSYCELTEDGNLYIAGNTGVVKVNIEDSLENVSDIKQAVPFLEADGKRIYPDEMGNFEISSRVKKLTVYSYVFNYSLTEPQVTYRLEGFDSDSVTVARSDLLPVTYTNLSGGTYHFEMEIKDAMGRESKSLSVTIVKRTALYERPWFYILCGTAVLLLLTLLVRMYVRKKVRAMEEKHREEAERERIGGELKMANRLQGSMLPHEFPPFPDRNEFDLWAVMNPAREVGGDFYDFFLIDEDHLCMVIADVSGKGIPASLFMMISKTILQSLSTVGKTPAEILTRANEAICANNPEDMFVTVWLGILEISTGIVTAANAGHEYPVVKQGEKFALLRDKHGLVIGGMEKAKYKEYQFTLQPGDKLFVYTDGVPEATDANNEMFGLDRMLSALNLEPNDSPELILKYVQGAVDEFIQDAEQFDDLTMLCLEYHGGQKKNKDNDAAEAAAENKTASRKKQQ